MKAKDEFQSTPVKITRRHHESISLHSHDYFELVYVRRGSAVHLADGRERKVEKGNYFFIDYGTFHRYAEGDGDFEIINCLFLPEFLDGSLIGCKSFREIASCYLIKFNYADLLSQPVNLVFDDTDGRIGDLFEKMETVYDEKQIGTLELIRCYLIEVIVFTLRKLSTGRQSGNEDKKVEYICRKIETNYASKLRLSDLCAELHFSTPYISRLFRETTGQTFGDYLQSVRIRNACHLLAQTDQSVEEIAFEVGYTDTKHFRKIFREEVKMSPLRYKKFCK